VRCDKDLDVTFKRITCLIVNNNGEFVFVNNRNRNVCTIELNDLFNQNVECFKCSTSR